MAIDPRGYIDNLAKPIRGALQTLFRVYQVSLGKDVSAIFRGKEKDPQHIWMFIGIAKQ